MRRSGWFSIAVILAWAATAFAALPRASMPEPSMKTIPPPALEALRRALKQATALLPAPERPYVLHAEETRLEVDPVAPWDARMKAWLRPGHASAVRSYDVPADAPGIPEDLRRFVGPIEITVELNGETRFPDLASEGGTPSLVPVKGATAVRVAVIAPEAAQGRMAAITPRQAEYRLAAITIFVGDPAAEAAVRSAVKLRGEPRPATAHTSDPSEVQLITVRIRGPLKPSEELARHIAGASLRQLLRR